MNDPFDSATISHNCHSQEYAAEQRQRNQAKNAAYEVEKAAEKKVGIAAQNVKGLCPKKGSCLVCRTARMNDKEYMALVYARQTAWNKYERLRTADNAIAHDVLNMQ